MNKILAFILAVMMVGFSSYADLYSVDLTTVTHVTNTSAAQITITNAGITNKYYTTLNTNGLIIGDPFNVAFQKVNSNFATISTYISTNIPSGTATATNLSGNALVQSTNIAAYQANLATNNLTPTITNIAAYQAYLATNGLNFSGSSGTATNLSGYALTQSTNIAAYQAYLATNNFIKTATNLAGNALIQSTNIAAYQAYLATNNIVFSGSATNAVNIYNGGATNLTVTNTFNLISTVPYYTISSYYVTNLPPDTNGLACSNRNGMYYLASQFGSGALTNACGFIMYLNNTTSSTISNVLSITVTNGTNVTLYSMVGTTGLIYTNTTPAPPSNAYTVYVTGAGTSGANGTYTTSNTNLLASIYQKSGDTNWFMKQYYPSSGILSWYIFHYADINVSYYLSNSYPQSTYPNGKFPPIGSWFIGTGIGSAPAPVSTASGETNQWAVFETNAWNFYQGTGVTFTPTNITYPNGSSLFCVAYPSATNAYVIVSNSCGSTYLLTPTNSTGFTLTNGSPNFTNTPSPTNLNISISSPATNSATSPSNTVSINPNCQVYVIFTINGVTKYLFDGIPKWDSAHSLNQKTGLKTSYLWIDKNGTATLVMSGFTSYTVPWESADWRTPVPSDSCNSTLYTTETRLY